MQRYETVIIVNPDLAEAERVPVFERVQEIIPQQGGLLVGLNEWGSKQMAYEIKKKKRGYYALFDFCGTGDLVNEMERYFRIEDRVLKYMTVLLDKEVDMEKIQEEMAAAERRRREEAEKAEAEARAQAEKAQAEAAAQPQEAAVSEAAEAPATEAPAGQAPVVEAPAAEAPAAEAPAGQAPAPEVAESETESEQTTKEAE
jgi:small subunit ribosomal protein S6